MHFLIHYKSLKQNFHKKIYQVKTLHFRYRETTKTTEVTDKNYLISPPTNLITVSMCFHKTFLPSNYHIRFRESNSTSLTRILLLELFSLICIISHFPYSNVLFSLSSQTHLLVFLNKTKPKQPRNHNLPLVTPFPTKKAGSSPWVH
jgi:hypothetical protein